MKQFDIITIFPELFEPFRNESLLAKAAEKHLLYVKAHNLRDWADNKHKSVDDKPFGGGLGMVMKIEPIHKAVKALKSQTPMLNDQKRRTILLGPRGKKFNQQKAFELSKYDQLIFICGRYEGIDERVVKYIADEQISLGDFVLMGGEIAAMAIIETVARLVPGVIGKEEFLPERTAVKNKTKTGFIEFPQYTRPEIFEPEPGTQWKVPKVLISGHHKFINEWKQKKGKIL